MPKATVPFAPRALIYIPGLGQDAVNSAAAAAESIARTLDRRRPDSVTTSQESPAAPRGLKAVCTLITDHDERLFDLYELDYRDRLEDLDREDDGTEGTAPNVLTSVWYLIRMIVLFIKATFYPYKSKVVKYQLFIGFLLMAVATMACLYVGALFVVTALQSWLRLPHWLTVLFQVDGRVAVIGGLLSGAAYLRFRKSLLRSARRIRQVMIYLDDGAKAAMVTAAVADGVDSLRDLPYDGEIHLLAYSFGGIVLLDELLPASGARANTAHWVHRVSSITTIGCPIDFLRLYYPDYYQDRTALRQDIPWQNVFIAADAFGSNLAYKGMPANMVCAPKEAKTINGSHVDAACGVFSGERIPGGLQVMSSRYLTGQFGFWSSLAQAALRQHQRYWSAAAGCWDTVKVLTDVCDGLAELNGPVPGPGQDETDVPALAA